MSMDDSWEFWCKRIVENWKVLESLNFIKKFKKTTELGFVFWEFFAIIKCFDDYHQRLKFLKAIQYGDFSVEPVHQYPIYKSKFAREAYRRIFSRADRRKYWFYANNERIMIDVPEKEIRWFM